MDIGDIRIGEYGIEAGFKLTWWCDNTCPIDDPLVTGVALDQIVGCGRQNRGQIVAPTSLSCLCAQEDGANLRIGMGALEGLVSENTHCLALGDVFQAVPARRAWPR